MADSAFNIELSQQIDFWLHSFNDKTVKEILVSASNKVGTRLLELAGDAYPPSQNIPPGPYKTKHGSTWLRTDKQRRWWWAMMHNLASGKDVPESLHGWRATYKKVEERKTLVISGGYRRTGTLVRSLTYRPLVDAKGVTIEFGPSLATGGLTEAGAYAVYVIGSPPDQARIHSGRWLPLMDLIENNADELTGIFTDEVVAQIDSRNATVNPGRSAGD